MHTVLSSYRWTGMFKLFPHPSFLYIGLLFGPCSPLHGPFAVGFWVHSQLLLLVHRRVLFWLISLDSTPVWVARQFRGEEIVGNIERRMHLKCGLGYAKVNIKLLDKEDWFYASVLSVWNLMLILVGNPKLWRSFMFSATVWGGMEFRFFHRHIYPQR